MGSLYRTPIAIFCNILRVLTVCTAILLACQTRTLAYVHDFADLIAGGLGIILMVCVDVTMRQKTEAPLRG